MHLHCIDETLKKGTKVYDLEHAEILNLLFKLVY